MKYCQLMKDYISKDSNDKYLYFGCTNILLSLNVMFYVRWLKQLNNFGLSLLKDVPPTKGQIIKVPYHIKISNKTL